MAQKTAANEKATTVVEEMEDQSLDDEDWVDEEREIDTEEILELATQINLLLILLMNHPKLNRTNPLASPKPLYFVTDFVRRTYVEYILPLLPPQAVYLSSRVANTFVIEYSSQKPAPPQDAPPSQESEEYLDDVTNWPEEDDQYKERYGDAVGRNVMIALTLTDPVKGTALMGGPFHFGDQIMEVAKMIAGGEKEEERVMAKYKREKGIDLSRK